MTVFVASLIGIATFFCALLAHRHGYRCGVIDTELRWHEAVTRADEARKRQAEQQFGDRPAASANPNLS